MRNPSRSNGPLPLQWKKSGDTEIVIDFFTKTMYLLCFGIVGYIKSGFVFDPICEAMD